MRVRARRIAASVVSLAVLLTILIMAPAGADGPAPQRVQAEIESCTTDAQGYCSVSHSLGEAPYAVALTPRIARGQAHYNLEVVAGEMTATSVVVRATVPAGGAAASRAITFSMVAYGGSDPLPTTPPTTTAPTTTVPPVTTTTAPPVTTTTNPPVTTTTPPTTTPPAAGGYPTPATTGVPAGMVFSKTVSGGQSVTVDGTVIDGWHITGTLEISAKNVVIRNSQIDGGVQNFRSPSSSFTLTDSQVGPPTGCVGGVTVWGQNFTALRVHSRGMENNFSTPAGNVTIRDSYVLSCSPSGDAHSDGFETCCDINASNPNIILDHSTWDQRPAFSATAPIDLAEALHVTNVSVTNNLVMGGAYTMYLENFTPVTASTPAWNISGNKWVDKAWAFGPLTTDGTCGRLAWGAGNERVEIDSSYRITKVVGPVNCD